MMTPAKQAIEALEAFTCVFTESCEDKDCANARAAIAALRADPWRPIAEAPKDGTKVDLWTLNGRRADCWFNAKRDSETDLL